MRFSSRPRQNRGVHNRKKQIVSSIVVVALALFVTAMLRYGGLLPGNDERQAQLSGLDQERLTVQFLDVGQGDSALLQTPNGSFVLIDTGPSDHRAELLGALRRAGVQTLSYMILSHPHEDHIGNAAAVAESFDVEQVWMTAESTQTATYLTLLETLDEQNIPVTEARAGLDFVLDDVSCSVLSPLRDSYDDLNDSSLVLRVTYGEHTILFTGDAEQETEQDLLNAYPAAKLQATVLKVGHHGSSTSTSESFLNAVAPRVCVISCGKNNDYGHPHMETRDRIDVINASMYRTDLQGTITITFDRTDFVVQTARDEN